MEQHTPLTRNRPLPWYGRPGDIATASWGVLLGVVITACYTLVASAMFDTPTSNIEIAALITSIACVWLVRVENIWSMPFGIAACALLGTFYLDIGLVGQGWLQLAFYIPVQTVGWWVWCRGGSGGNELGVRTMTRRHIAITAGAAAAIWAAAWVGFGMLYGQLPYLGWDTSIVAASIVAQGLLTWKFAEQWLVWMFPVNVSSIALYATTGAWAFMFLYTLYLANAAWGWQIWKRQAALDAATTATPQAVSS